jgi:hypothetical protein
MVKVLLLQFFFFISILSDFDFTKQLESADLDILKKLDAEAQDLLDLFKQKQKETQELEQKTESELKKQVQLQVFSNFFNQMIQKDKTLLVGLIQKLPFNPELKKQIDDRIK